MKSISFLNIFLFFSFLLSSFNAFMFGGSMSLVLTGSHLIKPIYEKLRYKRPLLKNLTLQLNFSIVNNVITNNLFLDYGMSYLASKIKSDSDDAVKSASRDLLLVFNNFSLMKEEHNKKKYFSFSIHFLQYFFSTYVLLLQSQWMKNKITSNARLSLFNKKIHAVYPLFNVVYPLLEQSEKYYHKKKNEKSIKDFFIKNINEIFSDTISFDFSDPQKTETVIDTYITQDVIENILKQYSQFRFDDSSFEVNKKVEILKASIIGSFLDRVKQEYSSKNNNFILSINAKLNKIKKNKNSNIKNILQSDCCKKVPPFDEFKRFILEEYKPV